MYVCMYGYTYVFLCMYMCNFLKCMRKDVFVYGQSVPFIDVCMHVCLCVCQDVELPKWLTVENKSFNYWNF